MHVALIMDGNGRWAKKQGKPRIYGHSKGIKVIPEIVQKAKELNIDYISFFAFSTENWNRETKEVQYLFNLFSNFLKGKNLKKIIEMDIRVKWIGFEEKMPKNILDKIYLFEKETKKCNSIQVNLFFNYSGVKDIEEANKKSIVNKKNIKSNLLTSNLPPIDLLIRTSGEKRISNFALYDLAYSEIIFENTLWPDYKKEIFENNIFEYSKRERRFGMIKNE